MCLGVILLDLEEKDLPGVAFRVVEQMAKEDLVEVESKAALMRALLLRHRPVAHHHDRFRFGVVRRNAASYTSLQVMKTGQILNYFLYKLPIVKNSIVFT